MEGWVIEARPEQQERMWWSGIRHAGRPCTAPTGGPPGSSGSGNPARGRLPGLEQQGSCCRDFLDWGSRVEEEVPVIESTWQWFLEHQPAEEGDVVMSWGDCTRIGNIIWQDFEAAAVVDWEMASLAQTKLDLGWWLYFESRFCEGLRGVPRPAGFGTHEGRHWPAATPT